MHLEFCPTSTLGYFSKGRPVDPTYFGVFRVLHPMFRRNPPPVGHGLYGTYAVGKVSMKRCFLDVFPFPRVTLIVVFMSVLPPPLVLFVPSPLLGS